MNQHVLGAMHSPAVTLGPGGSEAEIVRISLKIHFDKKKGALGVSNREAFVAHLSPDPIGILRGVHHEILPDSGWFRLSNVDNEATFTLFGGSSRKTSRQRCTADIYTSIYLNLTCWEAPFESHPGKVRGISWFVRSSNKS